jgi:hypothetical protein
MQLERKNRQKLPMKPPPTSEFRLSPNTAWQAFFRANRVIS